MSYYTLHSYDTEKYPFKEVMEGILEVSSLSFIHRDISWPLLTRNKDQNTPYHKLYYAKFKGEMEPLWGKFVKEVVSPCFDKEIYYQVIPTFRVQLPGNVGVGEYHTDADYGHTDGAVNIFLPMVDVNEDNTIWVESSRGSEDYSPMMVNYGEFSLWDGINLKHGNKTNPSKETRVSIDARFLEEGIYCEETAKSSINMHTKFGPGAYYSTSTV